MKDSQELANAIKEMAKLKNIPIGKMLFECKLSVNTLSSMQSGGYYPRLEALVKIADYLDCSIDYLLGRDQKEKSATEEKPLPDILYRYNELSEDKQREVVSFIEFKLAQQKEKPDDYIGQIAAFGSGPSDVPYNEKAARDLARYAKKLREKEQGKEKER